MSQLFKRKGTVTAMQFTGSNNLDILAWLEINDPAAQPTDAPIIYIHGSPTSINLNEWIIQDETGFIFVCSDADFQNTYEVV